MGYINSQFQFHEVQLKDRLKYDIIRAVVFQFHEVQLKE